MIEKNDSKTRFPMCVQDNLPILEVFASMVNARCGCAKKLRYFLRSETVLRIMQEYIKSTRTKAVNFFSSPKQND